MKTILLFMMIGGSLSLSAQVIFNPTTKTTVSSPAVSLEFGDYLFDDQQGKGLVVPYVKEADITSAVDGTIIMDAEDNILKIKTSGFWRDYSGGADRNFTLDTSLQDVEDEKPFAKVIIGSNLSDLAEGVLVLSDTDKAMVLPRVKSPHLNVVNPAAGMLVYDTQSKQLAVFNGKQWSFWKP